MFKPEKIGEVDFTLNTYVESVLDINNYSIPAGINYNTAARIFEESCVPVPGDRSRLSLMEQIERLDLKYYPDIVQVTDDTPLHLMLFGTTQAGKSLTTNYMCGIESRAAHSLAEMGNGVSSCSKDVKLYSLKLRPNQEDVDVKVKTINYDNDAEDRRTY